MAIIHVCSLDITTRVMKDSKDVKATKAIKRVCSLGIATMIVTDSKDVKATVMLSACACTYVLDVT
jgi:hypothetical protein